MKGYKLPRLSNSNTLVRVSILALIALSASAGPIVPDSHTVVLDHFNHATVGSPQGSPAFEPGPSGLQDAVDFGVGSYIRYGLTTALEAQGTIEMWLKPDAYNAGIMNFNWNNTSSSPPAGHVLHLQLDAGGAVSIGGWAWNPANMYGLTSADLLPLGQWSHIALSWSGSGAKIFVNGVLSASSSQPWQPASPSWGYLNYWGDAGVYSIDELHISDIQRTDAEIAMHASSVPEPTSLALFAIGILLTIGLSCRSRTWRTPS